MESPHSVSVTGPDPAGPVPPQEELLLRTVQSDPDHLGATLALAALAYQAHDFQR
jgi:hypothetical protein